MTVYNRQLFSAAFLAGMLIVASASRIFTLIPAEQNPIPAGLAVPLLITGIAIAWLCLYIERKGDALSSADFCGIGMILFCGGSLLLLAMAVALITNANVSPPGWSYPVSDTGWVIILAWLALAAGIVSAIIATKREFY